MDDGLLDFEIIDSKELATRWRLPETWIREHTRSRSPDPLPCARLGRYIRFLWGSPELEAWFRRRLRGGDSQARTKALDRRRVSVYQ